VLVIAGVASFLLFRPSGAPTTTAESTAPLTADDPGSEGSALPMSPEAMAPAAVETTTPETPVTTTETLPEAGAPTSTLEVRPPSTAPAPSAASPALVTRLQDAPVARIAKPEPPPTKAAATQPVERPERFDKLGSSDDPAQKAASTATPDVTTSTETEIPLPLAPPRLEPLPVGSDAARPRISPEVFVRRAQPGELVDLRDVDRAPVATSRPAPTYPPAARQMRRQGEVELRLLVDETGQVASVEVVGGNAKSDFAAAAVRAARNWKYRAATKDGVPVQVKIVEKVAFKL
jgi:protein TonB